MTPVSHRLKAEEPGHWPRWRMRLHEIIFESDTKAGLAFDIAVIVSVVASVIVVMLDSVEEMHQSHRVLLSRLEWTFTILFTVEYMLRLSSVRRPWRYAVSFFGIIDLLSTLPTYISLFFPAGHYLLIVRIFRLLRIFRILKLTRFVSESRVLLLALRQSLPKITVFLGSVLTIVCIMGAVMYLVEGRESGFTSIPRSMYWAIVTLTTVGYGDIAPKTALGQALASLLMIMGYGIIAVPTGIVSVELAQAQRREVTGQSCPACAAQGHDPDARHCKFCGAAL